MDILFPLFPNGYISKETNLILALFFGFIFGFILERSGFARSSYIAETFYFKNLAVPKIMGVAIITTTSWFIIFYALGLLDINALFSPKTYVIPYLIGGALFGIGMVMSGYCPGTAIAGVGTGKSDAFIFIIGLVAGMFLYFILYGYIKDFVNSTNMGVLRFKDLFGLNEYLSYLLTLALEIGIILFLMLLQKLSKGKSDE
ncbi:MAG: YeeE/YedE family protein [Epsilonproteobacteria bacterium]|nr:YeeE/YedE family protein [Campylobacterota bacterium]